MILTKKLEAFHNTILIPVLRTSSTKLADMAIQCLWESGYHTMEITMTIPGSHELIAQWAKKGLMVGAGTVFSLESAQRCIDAGASFIVSPIFIEGLPELCHRHDVLCILGAMTPSEVNQVLQAGSDVVKVYPAGSVGGPAHVKALLDVFPEALIMPTGGINLNNLVQYLEAGAAFLGSGSSLLDFESLEKGDLAKVRNHARKYQELIHQYKMRLHTAAGKELPVD